MMRSSHLILDGVQNSTDRDPISSDSTTTKKSSVKEKSVKKSFSLLLHVFITIALCVACGLLFNEIQRLNRRIDAGFSISAKSGASSGIQQPTSDPYKSNNESLSKDILYLESLISDIQKSMTAMNSLIDMISTQSQTNLILLNNSLSSVQNSVNRQGLEIDKIDMISTQSQSNLNLLNNSLSSVQNSVNRQGLKIDEIQGNFPSGMIIMWSGPNIPSGWKICSGSNGTPDLRDRFIVAAGHSYNVGATGGSAFVTLSLNEIPPHSHTIRTPLEASDVDRGFGNSLWSVDNVRVQTSSSAGGGAPHENRPPYYALYFIMKV
jgi:hypothetical protein